MTDHQTHTTGNIAAIVSAAVISIAADINVDALIGAFGGGIVFVMLSKDYSLPERFVYMVISILVGYFGGHEFIDRGLIMSHTIASFIVSALAVISVIIFFGLIKDRTIVNFILNRFGGSK